MPDTKEEAEMLRQLLDAGLYPKCADPEAQKDGNDSARTTGQSDLS